MYDFAMMVWNMSAEDFGESLVIGLLLLFVLYEGKAEINTNRIKRFNKK